MAGRKDKVTTFKIFVKNLAPGTSSEELKSIFETCGRVVECHVFRNTMALVHMEDEIGGRNAILTLNSRLIHGKCVVVEESTQREGPSVASTRIRIRNIPNTLSAKHLRSLFCKYGIILSVEISDDEGIVTIEAIADIRSAINDLNGYEWEGQKLIVEPIVNTSINYTPKNIRPVPDHPQKYSGPPRPVPRGFYPNRMAMPHQSHNNFEGRVLRNPYGPNSVPPIPSRSCEFVPRPMIQPPMTPVASRPPSNVTIEPLFFRRHEFSKGQLPNQNQGSFDEDVMLNNLDDGPFLVNPHFNGWKPPPKPQPLFEPQLAPRFGYQQRSRSPLKRQAPFPEPEEGQPFQVPGMVAPGTFQPPKKYFLHRPNRPKKKKPKTDRHQPPIPEEIQKPVPDFSSYYTAVPIGATLRPFPPPLNPDYDFSDDPGTNKDDVDMQTYSYTDNGILF